MPLSIIILAAGQGTRMRSSLPKVLQPLAGRPLLSHVVATAHELAADDVCVVYGHGGEAVPAAIGDDSLRWALQAEQLGTGHAVQQAMPETPDGNQVLVLFGDVPLLTGATLHRLLDDTGPDELAVLSVDLDDPTGYGRILREGDSVVGIVEQKDADAAQQAFDGKQAGMLSLVEGQARRDVLDVLEELANLLVGIDVVIIGRLQPLLDETQEVARQYGAVCTPDFFGYNRDLGRIAGEPPVGSGHPGDVYGR